MTDRDILILAGRHHVCDPFNVYPKDEDVLAFSRDLAALVMAELATAKSEAAALEWRERSRTLPAGASPMSDSDFSPLNKS